MTSGTSRLSDAKLSDVARHVVQPAGIVSTGWPAVRDTCAELGLKFDVWQDGAGRLIVAKRSDGQYASDTVVISIPRQVGKTYLVGAIVFALCIIFPGLTVVWTAHRFKTAKETFLSMEGMARRKKVAPHVADVYRGAGDQAVLFTNGSRVLFGARERGFGRGFADVGVLVLDEAQILTESAMEDMTPATNVATNPLIILTGTPPRPKDPGEVFTLMRQEALDGESEGSLYIEFSADPDADPADRSQWRKANPSFPRRTPERSILRMKKNLGEASFRREALGIWDEFSAHKRVVTAQRWSGLVDAGPEDGARPDALAVDASHGRQFSVAACWKGDEGAHAEEVWKGGDEDEVGRWLLDRTSRRMPIVVDHYSPAASLVPKLRAAGRTVKVTSGPDMAKACGLWMGEVEAGRLTHAGQQSVNDALEGARKRSVGSAGGWGWDRRDETAEIHPLVAHTLARFGAELVPRRSDGRSSGGRKAVVL